MSMQASAALQAAIHGVLSAAPELAGVAVHDTLPASPDPTFVLIGPEEVRDASDASGAGAEHLVQVAVIGGATGFLTLKQISASICTVLAAATLSPSTGNVVSLMFRRAVARRVDAGELRRIDLTFRVRIDLQ